MKLFRLLFYRHSRVPVIKISLADDLGGACLHQ